MKNEMSRGYFFGKDTCDMSREELLLLVDFLKKKIEILLEKKVEINNDIKF